MRPSVLQPRHIIALPYEVLHCIKTYLLKATLNLTRTPRNLNVDDAVTMLTNTLKWREEFNIEAALKEEYPEKKFSDTRLPGLGQDLGTILPRERGDWMLKQMGQETGWSGLRETLKEAFKDY